MNRILEFACNAWKKVTYIIPYGGFMVMNAMVQSEEITWVLLDQHVFPNSMPSYNLCRSKEPCIFTKQSQPQEFQDLTEQNR